MGKRDKPNKIVCKNLSTTKGKISGKECYDSCHKGQDIEIESKDFENIKKEKEIKEKERKEKREQSKIEKENINEKLDKSQCGLSDLTRIKESAIRCGKDCPKGIKAYKYHYDQNCRNVKQFKSDDPLVEARNYPILFFSTKDLTAKTPKQYKQQKKQK